MRICGGNVLNCHQNVTKNVLMPLNIFIEKDNITLEENIFFNIF